MHQSMALMVGAIVCIASANAGATSQDLKTGYLVGATPKAQQISILIGALASALVLGPILLSLNKAGSVYVPVGAKTPAGFTAGKADPNLHVDVSQIQVREHVSGAQAGSDTTEYYVYHWQDPSGGNAEKYLVDASGKLAYFVDPGINGKFDRLPNGDKITKFDAPKATLMSYIIKGILGGKLPWGLVLLGAMIAIVLEMSGIPSLAFAVGVYLPLSSSSPIFIGGMIRWGVDLWIAKKHKGKNLTEEQLVAEGDKSPGVLMASGYIAGGAIAGILIAFLAGVPAMAHINEWIEATSKVNPFYTGDMANLLSLIPFAIIILVLYLTGREAILAHRQEPVVTAKR
jgi:hypothetical protein